MCVTPQMVVRLDPGLNTTLAPTGVVTGAAATLQKSTSFTSDRMVSNYLYLSVVRPDENDETEIYHFDISGLAGRLAAGRQAGKDVIEPAGVLLSENALFTVPFKAFAGTVCCAVCCGNLTGCMD